MVESTYKEEFISGPSSNPAITLYTRTYTPAKPGTLKGALVFVHGFVEHIGRYKHVHQRWADSGFGVFAFDGRGFGRTGLEEDGTPRKGRGDGTYGRANDPQQMRDISWAIERAREKWPSAPIFLMGHSMGGGLVLAYATRPADRETLDLLSGVIASSPLVALTHPPSFITRRIGGLLSKIAPNLPINAPVDGSSLSHDAAVGRAYVSDPLVRASVTLGIVDAMLSRGEELVRAENLQWPEKLPLLVLHGDKDETCSEQVTQACFRKIGAKDKTLSIYANGFHELHNEPDGVAEKFIDGCIAWAAKYVPSEAEAPAAKL